jgi:hypothetical protein
MSQSWKGRASRTARGGGRFFGGYDLHSDRTSTHDLASNRLRLWWSAFGYLLIERVRAWCLWGSELARATLGSLRLRLLKVGAEIRVGVRRVLIELSSATLPDQVKLRSRRLRANGRKTAAHPPRRPRTVRTTPISSSYCRK